MTCLRRREHLVEADDGWRLSVLDVEPSAPPRGLLIAGHAMMVDRRTLLRDDRPSLVSTLAASGIRVLVPDLRGHGRSGPRADEGGVWGFDDLVADMPRLVELGRTLAPGAPLALLGHSLAGLVALAWLGLDPPAAAAICGNVCLACDVWSAQREANPLRRALKRAMIAGPLAIARRMGRLPARRFGAGSNDEALPYWTDYATWVRTGRWRSADGLVDYGEGLRRVVSPTLHVVSAGDRLYGRPSSALRFSAPLPPREVWQLGHPAAPSLLRGLAPGHMEMVTDPANAPLWTSLAAWLHARFAAHGTSRANR